MCTPYRGHTEEHGTVVYVTGNTHHAIKEYFNYLGSMITNDARCTREIKSMIAMAKAAFNKKKTLFTSKLGLNLRKKLVSATLGA
jgi:hypothetical protein